MNLFTKINLLILLFAVSSCATHTSPPALREPLTDFQIPKIDITYPSVADFKFLLPEAKLNNLPNVGPEVSTHFTSREISDIRIKDKKLFLRNNRLTLNLDTMSSASFFFPLPEGNVISPYGGKRKSHTGTDIKTCANDTIYSAFDGVVRMSKPYSAYGNVIVVRHYNGLETVYSHNSKNFVKPGDNVKAGTPIALTGRTGRASTEHLHFETRINGEHFNPSVIIDFKTRQLKRNNIVFTQSKNGNVQITPATLTRPVS